MGYDNERATRLVFDIETAPLPEAADYLEPAKAPGNYKDPAKIAAYIAEKNAENLGDAGLDVDLCCIVAIGWQLEGDEAPTAWVNQDEGEMLAAFWSMATGRHLVGFNCLEFDLPVLLRRSLYLGVEARRLQIDKFKHPDVTDLQAELSFGGKLKWRGLSFYCKRFGIQVPDALTGADIAQAVVEGRWHDIKAHVAADIQKTARLANKLGFFHLETQPALEMVL